MSVTVHISGEVANVAHLSHLLGGAGLRAAYYAEPRVEAELDADGNPVIIYEDVEEPVEDENGDPVVDENGNPVTRTVQVAVGFQTVETVPADTTVVTVVDVPAGRTITAADIETAADDIDPAWEPPPPPPTDAEIRAARLDELRAKGASKLTPEERNEAFDLLLVDALGQ